MQSLSLLSQSQLLYHAKQLVEADRKISLQLIDCLRECERRMLYADLGFSSLWDFATRYLGLSEGSAQLRINAMRLSRNNPEVKQALQSGALSLSNASQLHSFFQAEKKQGKAYTAEVTKEVIQSVTGLSKKECERRLFQISPKAIPQEQEREVSDTQTELKLILDAVLLKKLKRLKALLAHTLPQATYGELLEYLTDEMLAKLEKKKGGSVKNPETDLVAVPAPMPLPEIVKSSPVDVGPAVPADNHSTPTPRKYTSVAIRQKLWRRAKGQCEYQSPDGVRCTSCHALELDHVYSLALGGTHDESSLRYLCRTHNVHQAKQQLGSALMKHYVTSLR